MDRCTRCHIEFSFCFSPALSEALLDDVETTEAVVEGRLSESLVELFGGIGTLVVENVSIRYSPTTYSYEDDLPRCA